MCRIWPPKRPNPAAWTRAAAILFVSIAPALPAAAEAANLVANGDFSKTTDGAPHHWEAAGDQHVTQRLEAAKDADGKPYARLVCTRFDSRTPASHAMLAQCGKVNLVKGRLYEFSCRLRSEGLSSTFAVLMILTPPR